MVVPVVSRNPETVWAFGLVFFLIIICFGARGIEAQNTPPTFPSPPVGIAARTNPIPDEEMVALREIAEQMGKKDWNFSVNYCYYNLSLDHWYWNTPIQLDIYRSSVICTNATFDGYCHIRAIYLVGQDLSGVLPPSLSKLPYLEIVYFDLNYLNGTIPLTWASTKLIILSVMVNRLSGPIPNYLGNITSLTYLRLRNNMFNGTVPAELGNLASIEYLILSANNLTGVLPKELNNLRNLTFLTLSSNNFIGRLPSFQSWPKLEALGLQGSGFEGPIPHDISLLNNLEELRISNLNGGDSKFPQLQSMTKMRHLTLRNCSIYGEIPTDLPKMANLESLDLSFNRLEGTVPNFDGIRQMVFVYLTRNNLSGPIPEWINTRTTTYTIDLSYNSFSESSELPHCTENLNLFRSYFSGNKSVLSVCNSSPCQNKRSLHINCGGPKVTIGSTVYEADSDPGGSKETFSSPNWGTSATGSFSDQGRPGVYIAKNTSILTMDHPELYTNARLSPLSLTYYGRCLENGEYTVTLFFCEIIFRNNQSFHSLGRRIFDVYIQDELVLSNFNIKDAAQGVDRPVVKTFITHVKSNTIEIRFYWGIWGVSTEGNYGPLISAISVEANFKHLSEKVKKILIVVGVVPVLLCLVFIVLYTLWKKGLLRRITSREQDLRGLELQTGFFTLRQIKDATNNFNEANKIGEGGFGSVYKGVLSDGTVIAVKQLSSKSKQGNREFVNEIGMISGLQHPNLVRLYGCCIDRDQLLLVYEYMENNSLARALFGPEECQLELDWSTRLRICIGIAKGLAFLHEESRLKIVHRDIKGTNVLLDRDLNPKISDFGLAKLDEDENTHISTRIAGTIGYMAPEYALWGYLTDKADVYSFGVVLLEIVAGKNNMKYHPIENYVCLLDWAIALQQKGSLTELVDPKLGSYYNKDEAIRVIKVALSCVNPSSTHRPTMSAVVSMLEGDTSVQELTMDSYDEDLRFKALKDKYYEMQVQNSSEVQTRINLSETTRIGSSSTTSYDLYPISFDAR